MKLRQVIAQYVSFEQALGKRFRSNAYILRAFARALGEELDIAEVQPERVDTFLAGTGPVTPHWHRKYSVLAGFYRYALSRGYVAVAPLPSVVPKPPERFVPYIYSHDELRRLLAATASFPNRKGVLEPATLRAILLLLYGAGLRRSEALSLTLADVDLTEAIVTIRQTKFYKTRLVPLGAQLHEAMLSYAAARATAGHSQAKETFFFVTRAGAQVPDQLLDRAFRRLRVHAGIGRTDGGRYGPRLHDLRHTFAVHRLTEWYRAGADVQRLLPQLATYLGHVNISGTQVYLSMTPELLREAAGRFEQYALKEESHA